MGIVFRGQHIASISGKSLPYSSYKEIIDAEQYPSVTLTKEKLDGVVTIRNNAFYRMYNLIAVEIPATVTMIGTNAFAQCSSLQQMTVLADTPPTLYGNNWSGVPSDCTIYVPAASVAAYKAADNWSDRADYIQAIPE